MKTVYKGILIIKWYRDKPYSWVTKRYFYTPLNKIFWNFYLVIKYKRNTQYYKPNQILALRKYIKLHICKQTLDGYIINKSLSDLYNKETLLIRCLSKQDNSYIGCPHNTVKLINLGIYKFWKLYDENAVFGKHKDGSWYAWNGKDVAKLKIRKSASIEEVKELLWKLYKNPIERAEDYELKVNKEIRTETKNILSQLRESKQND
jgi:hypothetical protein